MIPPPLVFLYLAHFARGTSTTTSVCPPPDGNTRSLWSILGTCALTLVICLWHTVHPGVPDPRLNRWRDIGEKYKLLVRLAIWCFAFPEAIVAVASVELLVAVRIRDKFRDKHRYNWSITHSHFAQMGGFAYRDEDGSMRSIRSNEFLRLCEQGKIANLNIMLEDISDKSKSDVIGMVIYGLQLLWFILQVAARRVSGLAVTLVELDIVAMAVLTLSVIGLWLYKPLRPQRPYIFYSPTWKVESDRDSGDCQWPTSSNWIARDPMPRLLDACSELTKSVNLTRCFFGSRIADRRGDETDLIQVDETDGVVSWTMSFCATWLILGVIHVIAWNWDFPTQAERIVWRTASLVLTGMPLAILTEGGLILFLKRRGLLNRDQSIAYHIICMFLLGWLGGLVRMLLAALMLASLRALPCSAYEALSWVNLIPHL